MGWPDSYVAFDTETTGFDAGARIIEFAAVRFEQGEPVEEFSTLLRPIGVDWTDSRVQQALSVNKIDVKDLRGKPTFLEAFGEITRMLTNQIWCGHTVDFDVRMLEQEMRRIGQHKLLLEADIALDTCALAYCIDPSLTNHKLGTVAARWRVPPDEAHRAAIDARTSGLVLAEMFSDAEVPMDHDEMLQFFTLAQRTWKSKRRPTTRSAP